MSKSSIREREVVNLVMRQTDYTEEQSKEKLKQWNNNYINVIKEYLNPEFQQKKKETNTKTLNQQMLGEIRTFMDDVYIKFEKRKRYNNYVNILKQSHEQRLQEKKTIDNTEEKKEENEIVNKIKIEEVV
jgi:hypothetical protein|tara:strand:+ start:96 stop:485 length:390 start_codon:yes stop_codon:yes gene_type:complete